MNNTRQILQNEFTTRDEVLQNKTDVNELLNIQAKLDDVKFTGPAKKEALNRRRQLVKKLGFSDAFAMQKLNHMSEKEIKEVAELSRRERAFGLIHSNPNQHHESERSEAKVATKPNRDDSF